MRDEICISKEKYIELLKVLDMAVCIIDRSESRADIDNRIYSLSIAFAQTDMAARLAKVRKLVCELISQEEFCELDDLGIFDYEIPNIPSDSTLHELRKQLEPHLAKYVGYKKDTLPLQDGLIGAGELSKENILKFLYSFRKRTGMYISKPNDVNTVVSFLNGYMYCCFLQGFKCELSDELHIKDSAQFIDAVIKTVENYYPCD